MPAGIMSSRVCNEHFEKGIKARQRCNEMAAQSELYFLLCGHNQQRMTESIPLKQRRQLHLNDTLSPTLIWVVHCLLKYFQTHVQVCTVASMTSINSRTYTESFNPGDPPHSHHCKSKYLPGQFKDCLLNECLPKETEKEALIAALQIACLVSLTYWGKQQLFINLFDWLNQWLQYSQTPLSQAFLKS